MSHGTIATVAAVMLLTGRAWAQQEPDWSKIEIKSEKVAGNLYMLYGLGGSGHTDGDRAAPRRAPSHDGPRDAAQALWAPAPFQP